MQEEDSLSRAEELLSEGKLEECLSLLKSYWLNNPADARAALLLSKLMSEAGRNDLSSKLARLSGKEKDDAVEEVLTEGGTTGGGTPPGGSAASGSGASSKMDSPQELFEAGHGLIDIRQHELAAMLLNRAAKVIPDEPVVNYELGFSLMSLGRYKNALPYFEKALKVQPDFDTTLNLAVCYTMMRRSDDAHSLLSKLASLAEADDEKSELAHRRVVLKRLDLLKSRRSLNLRDWLFILYGSILLRPRASWQIEEHQLIATVLAYLKGVLEGLRAEIEAVEYYSPYSRPLAQILGELMELPFDSYRGPNRPDRAILVMSFASDIIGPHQAFIPNQQQRCLFAYGLTMKEPLPVSPDIVGIFKEEASMPWSDAVRRGQDPKETVAKILARARDLESDPDVIQSVQETVDYYEDKQELLVLSNQSSFPERPEYTAEFHEKEEMTG